MLDRRYQHHTAILPKMAKKCRMLQSVASDFLSVNKLAKKGLDLKKRYHEESANQDTGL